MVPPAGDFHEFWTKSTLAWSQEQGPAAAVQLRSLRAVALLVPSSMAQYHPKDAIELPPLPPLRGVAMAGLGGPPEAAAVASSSSCSGKNRRGLIVRGTGRVPNTRSTV